MDLSKTSPGHRGGAPFRTPLRRAAVAGIVAAAVALLAACGTAPLATTAPSAAPTAAAGRSVEIGGGRTLFIECRGSGSPTVVLIGGLRAGADYWDRPGQAGPTVQGALAENTRVCSYERPGTVGGDNQFSRSDPIEQPSSQDAAAEDLHALLLGAGERGPYVLAAHSYGGFIARLYAGRYPDEVSGLVLIDALSEGFHDALSPEQYAAWTDTTLVPAEDIEAYPAIERLELEAVMAEARSAPALPDIPLTVLSADQLYGPAWASMIEAGSLPPGTPADLGQAIDEAQRASQLFQAGLRPDSVHITQTHSGHDIPLQNAALVIDAITEAAGL